MKSEYRAALHWVVAFCFLTTSPAIYARSLFIEELTWQEVRAELADGKTTAIIFAGSTEQNGPQMALGKHNFIARYLAEQIALNLGDALIYPIFPYAPTGDPITRSGHMRFPGTVNVSEAVYAAVAGDVALSAIAAGFRRILLMGDHGDGQAALGELARAMDAQLAPRGIRVLHITAVFDPPGFSLTAPGRIVPLDLQAHAGTLDTATLMAIDHDGRWVRRDQFANANATNGAEEDPRNATAELGQKALAQRVAAALTQIRALTLAQP